MLGDTRCECSHQAQGWPERAIKSCQETDKGHQPQRIQGHGKRLMVRRSLTWLTI